MSQRWLLILICLVFLTITSTMCSGQIILRGMVADSATMEPLPLVNIVSKKGGRGTVTDIRGSFVLEVTPDDSVLLSRVGYFSKLLSAKFVKEVVIIFLKEERRMLKPVEIESKTDLPWLPELPRQSAWQNPTQANRFIETPGFQGIQTFGPGYVFKEAFSRLSKHEKEKKKLVRIQEENYRARNYVGLFNDPEVKGKIMKEYTLTEEEYYALLASFNQKK